MAQLEERLNEKVISLSEQLENEIKERKEKEEEAEHRRNEKITAVNNIEQDNINNDYLTKD